MTNRVMQNRKSRRGSGLVEFALALPVVVALVLLLGQFGYAIYAYSLATTAIRQGAEFASTADFDEPGRDVTARIKNVVVFGSARPETGANPRIPGLQPENVSVSWVRDSAGAPRRVTVTLRSLEVPGLLKPVHIQNRPAATMTFAGLWKTASSAPAN